MIQCSESLGKYSLLTNREKDILDNDIHGDGEENYSPEDFDEYDWEFIRNWDNDSE